MKHAVEEVRAPAPKAGSPRATALSGGPAAKPTRLGDVFAEEYRWLKTGIGELDNGLGGGIVPRSLVMSTPVLEPAPVGVEPRVTPRLRSTR